MDLPRPRLLRLRSILCSAAAAFSALLMPACADMQAAGFMGETDGQAADQLMIVDPGGRNFGWRRYTAACRTYATLGSFAAQHGAPDYYYEGEAPAGWGRAFVLFYLGDRKAHGFRRASFMAVDVKAHGSTGIDPRQFDHQAAIARIFNSPPSNER